MTENRTFEEARDELLTRDPELRESYDASEPAYVLGREVSRWRKERGLSQTELAERAGTTQAQISKIERMEVSPSLETAYRLARALGCRVDLEFRPGIEMVGLTIGADSEEVRRSGYVAGAMEVIDEGDVLLEWSPRQQRGRVIFGVESLDPESIARALAQVREQLDPGHHEATRETPEHQEASDR